MTCLRAHHTASHNTKMIRGGKAKGKAGCNCNDKASCPIPGDCMSQNVVYQALIDSEVGYFNYFGMTSMSFKDALNKLNYHILDWFTALWLVDYSRDKKLYRTDSNRRVNMCTLSTKKYVIKSLHGDIYLGYEFILRFGKFIALGFASYDKFASLNIDQYKLVSQK